MVAQFQRRGGLEDVEPGRRVAPRRRTLQRQAAHLEPRARRDGARCLVQRLLQRLALAEDAGQHDEAEAERGRIGAGRDRLPARRRGGDEHRPAAEMGARLLEDGGGAQLREGPLGQQQGAGHGESSPTQRDPGGSRCERVTKVRRRL